MLEVFTVASCYGRYLQHMLDSFAHFGYPVTVLAYQDIPMEKHHYPGHGFKLKNVVDFLEDRRKVDPDRVVVFSDAHDTLAVRSPESMEAQFRASGLNFVIGAEAGCYPVHEWEPLYPTDFVGKYKYLNSGTWISTVEAAFRIFADMRVFRFPDRVDDQEIFTEYYLRHQDLISLDRDAEYFQTLYKHEDHLEYGDAIRNVHTDALPYILHGNAYAPLEPAIAWAERSGVLGET